MNTLLSECIKKQVALKCPNKRKPKYTTDYYLTNIIDLLTDFVKWSSLIKSNNYINKSKYHYKTIADIHKLWSDNGVYESAYIECVQKQNISKGDQYIDLLIDSTLIINKSGIEGIGYGTSCRKKKFTKLTAISTLETTNASIIVDKVYDKILKPKPNDPINNPINRTIKTLSHDIKNVEPVIENLRQNIDKNIKIKIYGDKGYVMAKKDKQRILRRYNVKIVHCKRSNQKEKNMKKEEEILKKRYKVENMFAIIKSFNRIHIRRDKTISSYMGFVYLGCIFKFGKMI